MESSAMEAGTEIAARFDRATRSGLAASPLASFSYSVDSSTMDQPPTLTDLLPHLGSPDAPRCPACRACLPFGPRSRICLSCSARLVQMSPPSFTSTLAFRRFSEALHLDGLETDSGETEVELRSDSEINKASKFSLASLSPPSEVGSQKILRHADIPRDQGKPNIEPAKVKSDAQTPLSNSANPASITPAKPMVSTNVDKEKHAGVLDYSAKLEGISLEDFFSNQSKSQAPASAMESDILPDKLPTSMGTTPAITFHKDSLFWDPLSDSIIPEGFDLLANTSATNTNEVAHDNLEGVGDGEDLFSSWEGDFQSAAPATAEVSAGASSHTLGAQLSTEAITSRNVEDVFGVFPHTGGVETARTRGNDSWINGGDIFGLKMENPSNADSQRSTDFNDFFGSGWQQSGPQSEVSAPRESLIMQDAAPLKSSQADDLLGIHSSKEGEAPTINHSLDSVGKLASTENLLMGQLTSASDSGGKKGKIVGSLLAQLHDLSFLLADKLVVKAEGKNTKPDFSS